MYAYGDYSLTIKILSNMGDKTFFCTPRRSQTLEYTNDSIKSVEKCKRYSAFYPAPPQLHCSLALFTVQPLPSQDGGELARRSNHNHIYICLWQQCPSPCLFIRTFFSFPVPQQSAADFYKIKACEQQTFTIIKKIIKPALTRDQIIVAVN